MIMAGANVPDMKFLEKTLEGVVINREMIFAIQLPKYFDTRLTDEKPAYYLGRFLLYFQAVSTG